MPQLEMLNGVFVLDLGNDENRFHPEWSAAVGELLDTVEKAVGPRALVTTAQGKFFSNGLDLERFHGRPAQLERYLADVERLFARLLALPLVTVAALQGHTFAAGAMLSLAHDVRVMRADRGYWCLPEATLGIAFTPGMAALIRARLAPRVAHEAVVTARHYGGDAALAAGIVDHAVDREAVRATALAVAGEHTAKAGDALGKTKTLLYGTVLTALRGNVEHRPEVE